MNRWMVGWVKERMKYCTACLIGGLGLLRWTPPWYGAASRTDEDIKGVLGWSGANFTTTPNRHQGFLLPLSAHLSPEEGKGRKKLIVVVVVILRVVFVFIIIFQVIISKLLLIINANKKLIGEKYRARNMAENIISWFEPGNLLPSVANVIIEHSSETFTLF